MAGDLWGFKNRDELERRTEKIPDAILKEQIVALGEKTGFVLYGKALCMKVKNHRIHYTFATIFNVVVPALDDYSKTILIMYSDSERDYPVAITVGKSFNEDMEFFKPSCVCKDADEFSIKLREVLNSDAVMNIIKTLYSKANVISRYEDDSEYKKLAKTPLDLR